MLGRVTRRVVNVQKRNFSVFDNKNKINETRSKFYSNPAVGAENPTYLKQPGDKLVTAVGLGSISLGLVLILKGLYDMSLGINKVSA